MAHSLWATYKESEMAFGQYRNSGISWFRDYGDALHKYENTTDIRGRVEEPKRPLGHRKAVDNYSIRKADKIGRAHVWTPVT